MNLYRLNIVYISSYVVLRQELFWIGLFSLKYRLMCGLTMRNVGRSKRNDLQHIRIHCAFHVRSRSYLLSL